MKKFKYLLCVLLILTLCGCGSIPKLEDGKEVLFEVNGKGVSVDEFYKSLKEKHGTGELIESIDTVLLNELYETTDEIKSKASSNKDSAMQYYKLYYGYSEEQVYSAFGCKNESELLEYFIVDAKRSNANLDYAKTLIKDEEIKDYYDNKSIGDIKASHILIKVDAEDSTPEEELKEKEKEALNTAKDIIKKLDNGEDFAKLAKEYGSDGTKDDGGDLGYFNRDDMVKEFEDAAIKLKVGEYTKTPVKTKFGYHVILKTDEKDKKPYDELKDSIKERLAKEKVDNTTNIYAYAMEWIRNENGLKIYDSDLKDNYEHYMNSQKTVK